MKNLKLKIALTALMLCLTFNLKAQEVPLTKRELKALKKQTNTNNSILLDNLVNPIQIKNNENQTIVFLNLLSNKIEFRYKKVGNGVQLISIEENAIDGSFTMSSDFIEDGLNLDAIKSQKTQILKSTSAIMAVKKLLKPVLIKAISKQIDKNGTGKGLLWTENFVYTGTITDGHPDGEGKQFNFDNELVYEGQIKAFKGRHGHGKALIRGDYWEGEFNFGRRLDSAIFKSYHPSPSTGKITVGEGPWSSILYTKVGLWHFTNPDGSIEEIDFGSSGTDFNTKFVKHADINTDVNSFDDVIKSIRDHMNQQELYFTNYKEFNTTKDFQLVLSEHQLTTGSSEFYFLVLPKGSTNTPTMKFTLSTAPEMALDVPLKEHKTYSSALGYPVYYALYENDNEDFIFDIHTKGTDTSEAILLLMGAKTEDIRLKPALCPHGYVTN